MPAIAPNIPEPSCIVAIIHPTNAPLTSRAESPMACVREGVFGSTSTRYSDGSHREDDTPAAAAHFEAKMRREHAELTKAMEKALKLRRSMRYWGVRSENGGGLVS